MLIPIGWKKDGKQSKNDNRVDSFIWHLRVLIFCIQVYLGPTWYFLNTHYSKVALVLFPSRFMIFWLCSLVTSFGFENPMKVIKGSLLYHRDGVLFFDMANQLENSTIAKILLFLVSWMPVTSCFLQLYGRSWNLKVIPLLCVKAYAYRRLQSFLTSS